MLIFLEKFSTSFDCWKGSLRREQRGEEARAGGGVPAPAPRRCGRERNLPKMEMIPKIKEHLRRSMRHHRLDATEKDISDMAMC